MVATRNNQASFSSRPTRPRYDPRLDPIRREIITYRRELPRLIAEGLDGRFVLIKGDEIVCICDTSDEAHQAGAERFGLGPYLAQPIDQRDLHRAFPKELDPPKVGAG
jgi:hypothetical protein